jgi:predicted DNA-binding transcriptional regulator AlpA
MSELIQPADYIDENSLAERYHIPPRTAQRWRSAGGGPPFVRLGARRVVYRVADIERWLAEHTFASRAEELSRGLAARRQTSTSDLGPGQPLGRSGDDARG